MQCRAACAVSAKLYWHLEVACAIQDASMGGITDYEGMCIGCANEAPKGRPAADEMRCLMLQVTPRPKAGRLIFRLGIAGCTPRRSSAHSKVQCAARICPPVLFM